MENHQSSDIAEVIRALRKGEEVDVFGALKLLIVGIAVIVIGYLAYVVWKVFNTTVVKPVEGAATTIASALNAFYQVQGYIAFRIAGLGLTFQTGTHPQGLIPRETFDSWVRSLVRGQISARVFWSYCGAYYSMDEVWQIWVMVGTLNVAEYQ
jgi:hypothetical protein